MSLLVFARIETNGTVIEGYRPTSEVGGEDLADYVQCTSFEWGAERNIGQGGNVTGNAQLRRVTLHRTLDQGSPLLLQALAVASLTNLEVKLFRSGEDGADELFMHLVFKDARLTSLDWDAVAGGERGEETVSFHVAEADVSYVGSAGQTQTVIGAR